MFVGVYGNCFFNTTALVTSVRNFPRSRGLLLGLLKGVVGLSGAIYAQLYNATLAPDQASFLLLLAVGPAAIALLVVPFLHPTGEGTPLPPPTIFRWCGKRHW